MLETRAQVRNLLRDGESFKQARERRSQIAGNPERTSGDMTFLLKLTALDMFLDRYFRNPGETMFQSTQSKTD